MATFQRVMNNILGVSWKILLSIHGRYNSLFTIITEQLAGLENSI